MAEDETTRIKHNLNVIRVYLARSFVGFGITEDKSDHSVCHFFTLSHPETSELFRLRVAWSRLSDDCNTPERTMRSLEHGFVAGKMRNANGDYFSW